ncbi:hypothetical protein POTOM_050686 [Populus tomentosa]|uniref:Uncharacterized protein n=1 Tax=Populus tomentosa TaxID=118781 RepID=A0A8X7YAX1_POPTO|nr:hypothetical protein POTOM_050686 [Populus tomentosa]
MQVGPTKDILNHEHINNFENNSLGNVNLNISNGVMPLQYYTIEYQISSSGFSAVANVGSSMYRVVSTLPVHAHSGTCLCNPNDLTASWNSQHSFPYNSINCAPNLGNGQVYQGERSVLGVSTLWGSHNIPQVPAMALQLAGVTLVPALTPQMAGGNVHTGAPPWFEATEENQLNIQFYIRDCLGRKEKDGDGRFVKSDCDDNWLPNFGRVWQHGSQKESRKEFENEKQKLPNVESHTEMPVRIQPYISKQMKCFSSVSDVKLLIFTLRTLNLPLREDSDLDRHALDLYMD